MINLYPTVMKQKTFSFIKCTLLLLLAAVQLNGQNREEGFAPFDPEIRTGRLDNGLTYFIRHNSEPEKRASFYIIQNVGAILENDDQNGLAHFLEHMAFNGTLNFPGKAVINSLEKHGVAFGRNINAYTGFDETVYNLSDVPVDKPGLIDSCLLILHDWSDFITLDEKEIDLERGVISEEWRTSKTASRRMIFGVIPVVLKGSKYAERDIIGDLDIIQNFSYETLRRFYHDWYRTDLQAIAIVGDIDVDEVEAKVKTLFSKIPAVQDPLPRTQQEVPDHEEPYYVLVTDKEAPRTSVSLIMLHKGVAPEKKDLKYIRDNHIISLMNSMMDARTSELVQKPDPPFVTGYVSYGEYYARGYDALAISATARKNEEALAFKAIYTEAERAVRYGFNEGELKRAKASMLSAYENIYKQKDKINNDTYISGIQAYYLTGEPLTSIDFDYEYLKQVLDGISAEEVTEKLRGYMTEENRTLVIQGLEGDDVVHLSENEAFGIISDIKGSEITPYEDEEVAESLVNTELRGSPVIKITPLPAFDAEEWTLANNVKVIYRKADFEKDNVLLSAFSYGGISLLEDDQVLAANLLPTLSEMYGAGDFDNITLQKMMAGKQASLSLSLGETAESISGSSTPGDLETMMQLLWLRFAGPRFDSVAHSAIIGRYASLLINMEKDPQKIMSDSLNLITTGHHPRTPVLTSKSVSSITLDEVRDIYTGRFRDAADFTFIIVGNIEKELLQPLVEKYIGSLPTGNTRELWIDRKIRQPRGKLNREIDIPLTVPKASVYLVFSEEMKYKPANYLGVDIIGAILDIVLTEKVREEQGGTYGVGVSLSASKRPSPTAGGVISFDCDPERATELKGIIYSEINNLIKDGPSEENLSKAVKNMIKTREENRLHNSYWLSTLSRYYNYGIDSNDPRNFDNILQSFTVNDIKKIASKVFKKADVADIVFMPAEHE